MSEDEKRGGWRLKMRYGTLWCEDVDKGRMMKNRRGERNNKLRFWRVMSNALCFTLHTSTVTLSTAVAVAVAVANLSLWSRLPSRIDAQMKWTLEGSCDISKMAVIEPTWLSFVFFFSVTTNPRM